jgi:hypothetical protein
MKNQSSTLETRAVVENAAKNPDSATKSTPRSKKVVE